jgi:streptogramin lyase
MYKNLKWLRLVPDKPGKGGQKTGYHSFQAQPVNDTRQTRGFHVYRGRWRKDYVPQVFVPYANQIGAGIEALSLHYYAYPNLTDPSATPNFSILGHHLLAGTHHIWDFTTGTSRFTHTANAVPATFLNIEGRCFAADGGREGMILDDRTPAIHTQANQNLGIGTPTQALQATDALPFIPNAPATAVVPNLIGGTLAYTFTNNTTGSLLHSPDPDSGLGRIQANDVVTVSLLDPSYSYLTGPVPAATAQILPGRSSNNAADAAAAPFLTTGETITCVSGSSVITRSGGWPAGIGRVAGLRINFNGYSFMLGATSADAVGARYDVNGDLSGLGANQAFIIGEYDGPNFTGPFTITGCELEMPAGAFNTLTIASSPAGTLGYGQATNSALVPILVSAALDQSVWFTEFAAAGNNIGRMTTAGAPTEYLVPGAGSGPFCICFGPDGNLWFTEGAGGVNQIGKSTTTGVITEYATTGAPFGICAGPDGNLWFTENGAPPAVSRITTAGVITRYVLPAGFASGICTGPDGFLWFTDQTNDTVSKISPSTGVITTYPLSGGAAPMFICAGQDGNLWFSEPGINGVGCITTDGAVTEYLVGITGSPAGICLGSDGNIWFTEPGANLIGTITSTGVVTEYGGLTAFASPTQIVGGPDGNLWFTELVIDSIGTMTTAGVLVAEYGGLAVNSSPSGITAAGGIRNLGKMTLSGTGLPISPVPWTGPTYAYAWYDPETGHMSNISPLTTIATPPAIPPSTLIRDYQNVTPYFRIDNGFISYPEASPSPDRTRFSHIMFFRTLSTGGDSTLYPIGSLQPFVGKVHPAAATTRGSWNPMQVQGWFGQPNVYVDGLNLIGADPNYWYDFSSDEDLILSGGFRAPQYTNEKPMVTLRGGITQPGKVEYQAYWDRRLWVVCTQEPTKIAFSCDEAQCPLGVPVESFPPTNFLRIPGVDGRVVGMKTIGEMLIITTDRWAYSIAGNNESNYRLIRISTRMGGVGVYQISEMTSDVEGQAAIVYFLGRDKIVYEWIPGGPINPISDPVQDTINTRISTTAQYQSARIHAVSAWARRLVVLSFGGDPTTGKSCLIFDATNRVWTENWVNVTNIGTTTSGPSAMATIYGQTPPVNEIFSAPSAALDTIYLWSWLRDDGAVQTLAPVGYDFSLLTFPLNFDGLKTRKQLIAVNAHVSADFQPNPLGTNHVCSVAVNEGTPVVASFTSFYDDPLYSIYAASPIPVDSGNAADVVVMTAQFTGAEALVGYRFTVGLSTLSTTAPTEVYAIDVGYVDWEEAGEGDP